MRKLKVYLDTSVINFLFADDAPEKKEVTVDFFENYLIDYEIFISDIVIDEISRTKDDKKRDLLLSTIAKYELEVYSNITPEIIELAELYVSRAIIPQNKHDDALHLAFASYYEFDVLLSWNFKHLANLNKQDKVNTVNLELGYRKQLIMTNPMELVYEK